MSRKAPANKRPTKRAPSRNVASAAEPLLATWLGAPVHSQLLVSLLRSNDHPPFAARAIVTSGRGSTAYENPDIQAGPLAIPMPEVDSYSVSLTLAFMASAEVHVSARLVTPDGKQFQSEYTKVLSHRRGDTANLVFLVVTGSKE